MSNNTLDREVDLIARTLEENCATERRSLARLVGARHWGPGRFSDALREAVAEGVILRVGRNRFAPAGRSTGAGQPRGPENLA